MHQLGWSLIVKTLIWLQPFPSVYFLTPSWLYTAAHTKSLFLNPKVYDISNARQLDFVGPPVFLGAKTHPYFIWKDGFELFNLRDSLHPVIYFGTPMLFCKGAIPKRALGTAVGVDVAAVVTHLITRHPTFSSVASNIISYRGYSKRYCCGPRST